MAVNSADDARVALVTQGRKICALCCAFLAVVIFTGEAVGAKKEYDMFRKVRTKILQPLDQLLQEPPMSPYATELRGADFYDNSSLYLEEFASGDVPGRTTSGGPLVLNYDGSGCDIELPAGRRLVVKMMGPVVDRAESIFPMEPLDWGEMQSALRDVVGRFDSAGWDYVGGAGDVNLPVRVEDFGDNSGPKYVQMGFWQACGTEPALAYLTVMHYNSLTGSSFTPPAILSAPLAEDAPDRFILRVVFKPADDVGKRITELTLARRAAEGLDPAMEKLPASVWLDDPDWRPPGWTGGF